MIFAQISLKDYDLPTDTCLIVAGIMNMYLHTWLIS
jgi:hypothetical protein